MMKNTLMLKNLISKNPMNRNLMKKFTALLCSMVIFASCCGSALAAKVEIPDELRNLVVFNLAATDQPEIFFERFTRKVWNIVPEQFQQLLIKRNTTIEISFSIKHPDEHTRILGEYIPKENKIITKIPLNESSRAVNMENIFFHELGHYIDDINHKNTFTYSHSKAWRKLSEDEKEFISFYDRLTRCNCYDAHEMFAEAFRIYMLDRDYLEKWAPHACKVVAKAIADNVKKYKRKVLDFEYKLEN